MLSAHVHTYTSWCGTLLVDMSVPSDSIVSPSLDVQWGYTPLMRAAQKGHGGVSRFLLARRSSVQEQNNVGWPKGVLSSCDHLMLFSAVCALLEIVGWLFWTIKHAKQMTLHFQLSLQCNVSPVTGFVRHTKPVMGETLHCSCRGRPYRDCTLPACEREQCEAVEVFHSCMYWYVFVPTVYM